MRRYIRLIKRVSFFQWILVGILVLAAFVRLYQSTQYIPFSEEQVDDMLSIRSTWHALASGNIQKLSLKGQVGTYRSSYLRPKEISPVYHGVAYYYVLLPAAVISQFNPYGVVLFLIFLGMCSVYLLYDAGLLLFKNKTVGLLAAFLGAISFWMSAYSRWIWTPSMVSFFSLVSLVSFLRVISGKTVWLFPLVASLSLGSQVHDSGYVPLVFFYLALLFYRPKVPKGVWSRLWLVLFGLGPIIPTIVNEVSERFHMVRSLSFVAYNAVPTITTIGTSLFRFAQSAIGSTIMSQKYIEAFVLMVRLHPLISMCISMALIGGVYVSQMIWPASQSKRSLSSHSEVKYKPLILLWWIMCLPVSVFVEYLYADQVLNDYSRMNNFVFALPMFLLCISYLCLEVWKKGIVLGRLVVIVGLSLYVVLNIAIIRDYLWGYTERDWAYQDLKTVSWLIPHIAGEEPYDLTVYRYQEGSYESKNVYVMLYFIESYPARMPERFNGGLTWGVTKEMLQGRIAHQHIIVVDKRYVGFRELPKGAVRVDETKGYVLYRALD